MIRLSLNYSKLFKRSCFVFVWLLCFLSLVEIGLRGLGYLYSKKPHLDEISDSQSFNIICLGDSFTYGLDVEACYSYPEQLEKMLNRGNLDRQFKVFNLAIPGSNSSQQLKYLEDILNKYKKPDLIIILTGANDSWNLADSNIYRFVDEKKKKSDLINIRLKILYSKLRVYKMLKLISLNLKGRPPESRIDPFKLIPRYEDIDVEILKKLLEYNLTRIVDLAKSMGIEIILQNYPRGDIYGENITEKVAGRLKVPFNDNYAAFNEKLKSLDYRDLFLYDISHPNEQGYKVIAENLYEIISKMVKED